MSAHCSIVRHFFMGIVLVIGLSSSLARAGGGAILPPAAQPQGWTLDEMAAAVANFSISGNDEAFHPDTPFQIIYRRPGNTFAVKPGTNFYIKFFFIDDAAPVIGDWPANKDEAADYVFGADQLGGHDLEVQVDEGVFARRCWLHRRTRAHARFTRRQRTPDPGRGLHVATDQGHAHGHHSRSV
jgi:hypothetical protein